MIVWMAPFNPLPARIIGASFGLVFATIGVMVLVHLWTASGFGEPPLFFKLFGSCIAFIFVVFGGCSAFSVVTGKGMMATPQRLVESMRRAQRKTACEVCGAPYEAERDEEAPQECPFCGSLRTR